MATKKTCSAFRAHPWHGISAGEQAPEIVTAFVEIVPSDSAKFELDKLTGFLRIDRPQRFSSFPPTTYGFIPRTLCGPRVGANAKVAKGDGDPLDVCVLMERPASHGDFICECIPIGGLRCIDRGEADDKLIAVLLQDEAFAKIRTLSDLPPSTVRRITHYFSTYKAMPGEQSPCVVIDSYEREEALNVVRLSIQDYDETYPAAH